MRTAIAIKDPLNTSGKGLQQQAFVYLPENFVPCI
jgi:hypothetical protein